VRRTIPDQRLVLRDGRTLGYIEVGDPMGVPIFCFHGLPGSRLDMQFSGDVCRELGIRLICPDRPGYGLSDFQPRRTLLDWPADVAQLADALGIARFAVLGVSGGGPYACACVYALPERVTVAGLASSAGPPEVRGVLAALPLRTRMSHVTNYVLPWPLRWPLMRLGCSIEAALTRQAPESRAEFMRWLHGDGKLFGKSAAPSLPPAVRDAVTEPFRQGGRGRAWDSRLLRQRWRIPLKQIHVPVLLWHGERDPFSPAVVGRYLAQTIPGCQATFYPNEKHYVLSDHEREILSTLAAVGRTTMS
jgi:pimeloyl-ACP methyl ester carboxylesterase